MKKINIAVIFLDHLSTLRDDRTGERSWPDLILFYALPIALALAYYSFPFSLPDSIEASLIAVFAVFAALLFSAQIALYGLSPRAPDASGDKVTDEANMKAFDNEKKFFREVNFNISYLILISSASLVLFLILMITHWPERIEGAILVLAVSHFFLTLLMLIKRTHVAFAIRHSG